MEGSDAGAWNRYILNASANRSIRTVIPRRAGNKPKRLSEVSLILSRKSAGVARTVLSVAGGMAASTLCAARPSSLSGSTGTGVEYEPEEGAGERSCARPWLEMALPMSTPVMMSPRPGPLRAGAEGGTGAGVGVGARSTFEVDEGGVGAGRGLVASCTATAPAAPTAAAAAAFRYVCADCSLARLAVASRKNTELGVCVGATAGGAEGLEGLDEEDEPKLPKLELDDLVDSDLLGEEYEGEREGAGAEYDELLDGAE